MAWVFWMFAGMLISLIAAIAYGFLAPLKVHVTEQIPLAVADQVIDPGATPKDAPFVGLALSGGGGARCGLCRGWDAGPS